MRKFLLSMITASTLLASGLAVAQTTSTTTTTTWTSDQGTAMTDYSTSQKYVPFIDPSMQPTVGFVLPPTVTMYPLPATMKVEDPTQYNYAIINGHPVIIERATRKVVHSWD